MGVDLSMRMKRTNTLAISMLALAATLPAGVAFAEDDSQAASAHEHAHHDMHTRHAIGAPAGVMYEHVLANKGDVMVGYRYMYSRQSGDILHNGDSVSDATLASDGCRGFDCNVRPTEMTMRMHMLDIMYAPTDWLTLMIMPQFMEMEMSMRQISDPDPADHMSHMAIDHALEGHKTSGLADTEIHALFSLHEKGDSRLHMGLGLSVPTGEVDAAMNMSGHAMAMDYGMQLGSGTLDFKPSVTYTNTSGQRSWGAQAVGVMRLESENKSGYALGDMVQATAWLSQGMGAGISASVRGLYTWQDAIRGKYNNTLVRIGPNDYASNYGGRFLDLGLGLSATIQSGALTGHRVSLEWLQPVMDDPNGYQLERKGTLVFNWGMHL